MTKHNVEHIRILYLSGLYHKADLVLRFLTELKEPQELERILNYNVYQEIRPELQLPIYGMVFIKDLSDTYQDTLRHHIELENQFGESDDYPMAVKKAKKDLREKLKIINKEFNLSFSPYDLEQRICKFF